MLTQKLLLHDVEYRSGQHAVDWIAFLPDAVLIVEMKATPLSEGARQGSARLAKDLARAPGRGIAQIDRTVKLIRDRNPELAAVPVDRPFMGLVATLEPYFQCNSNLVWRRTPGTTPVVLASSRELETLVCVTDLSPGTALTNLVADAGNGRTRKGSSDRRLANEVGLYAN